MTKLTTNIKDNFPFISVVQHASVEIVGIYINQDPMITSIYNFQLLRTEAEKQKFLEMGEIWWWESNRTIPINIFLKSEMEPFKYAIRFMNTKDVKLLFGPSVCLHDISKRTKRRTIQLIKPAH